MPGDFHYQETKPPLLKDAYDEYLARIVCFVFSISPEAFVGQVNRATAETSQARAVDEGLAPLMRFVRNFLNRVIAQEFASPDLEFAWEETRAQDPMQAAQIDVAYVSAGILTVNEVRANLGMAPLSTTAENAASATNDIQAENALKLQKKTSRLRKDEDDEDDEDDSDDNDSDDADESGSDFDDQHPRWPSGSPGGIGGEFAPKDSGDATGTLHDALAQSEQSTAPLDPDSAWAALTSAIDKPSRLAGGTEVAQITSPIVGDIVGTTTESGIGPITTGIPANVGTIPIILNNNEDNTETNTTENDDTKPLPKPDGIPDDWIEKPSEDGKGVQWVNPDNPNDRVRVMPGNPDAEFDSQKEPYVIDQDGGFRDVNGNPILGQKPGRTPEAHIPYSQFKFRR